MAYLLTHKNLSDEIALSDIGDAAYRALFGSMFYVIRERTDWLVPVRDLPKTSPTYTDAVYDELVRTRWWIHYHDDVLLAVGGPRDRQPLMRRCQDDRVPISPAVRAHIYERDGFRCVECGSPDDLSLDHIWPWSRGGTDEVDNLRTLCRPCNSRKGAKV